MERSNSDFACMNEKTKGEADREGKRPALSKKRGSCGFFAFLLLFVILTAFVGCQLVSEVAQEAVEAVSELGEQALEGLGSYWGLSEDTEEENANRAELATWFQTDAWYHYSFLNEEEKALYLEMLEAALEMSEEEISVPEGLQERVLQLLQLVCYDNPQIFWVSSGTIYSYTWGDTLLKTTFVLHYTMDEAEKEDRAQRIEAVVSEILSQLPAEADDYTKVRFVYDYLVENTEYEIEAAESQNICSVFLYGESVCQGYSLAAQYLLSFLGIECITVSGTANGVAHAWNVVWVDGEPYYMDVTWGDPEYLDGTEETGDVIHYEYFLVTSEVMERDHQADDIFTLPTCCATENNYFVREGCLFTKWSEEQLLTLICQAIEEGRSYFYLVCEDEALYQQLRKELIDAGGIFAILRQAQEKTGVSIDTSQFYYSLDEERGLIMICMKRA